MPGTCTSIEYRSAAVDLARQLDTHHVLADQSELVRLLQVFRLDVGCLCRNLGEGCDFAVGQLAAGPGVHDHAWLGRQFRDRDAKLARRIFEQTRGATCAPMRRSGR